MSFEIKLKEKQIINITNPIVSLAISSDFVAAGGLDDSLRVWKNNFHPFNKQPYLFHNEPISGITDICFNQRSTHLATVSFDSTIKIWQLDTKNVRTIQPSFLSAMKLTFSNQNLISCGDLGKILVYDLVSKEIIHKMQAGENCLTSILSVSGENRIVVGNIVGQVFIVGPQKKQEKIRPHFKPIRTLTEINNHLLTGSDDSTISLIDIHNLKIVNVLEGHSQRVNCIKTLKNNNNIAFSCSNDKQIKTWDLRTSKCINTHISNGEIWTIQCTQKHLLSGGQLGILNIFSIE